MRSAERGTRNKVRVTRRLMFMVAWAGIFLGSFAHGAEDPDALYREGRFGEAQKIYARSDMDHPKDLRYRYNRGCAEYQAGEYKGAAAAFSSVLRRAEDRGTRFRAAYNLGNAAFKQGDAASAAEHYRQAIRIDPDQEHARYNLELALRQLEAQKKEEEEKEKSSGQEEDSKDPKREDEKEKGRKKPSPDTSSEKDGDQEKGPDKKDERTPPEDKKGEDEGKETGQGPDQKNDQKSPEDLSGELKLREDLPEQREQEERPEDRASSLMERKKAEALLDNVTEDRSKFLRLQMPEGRRRGAVSGKDW